MKLYRQRLPEQGSGCRNKGTNKQTNERTHERRREEQTQEEGLMLLCPLHPRTKSPNFCCRLRLGNGIIDPCQGQTKCNPASTAKEVARVALASLLPPRA